MALYFSASAPGFFCSDMHRDIPTDAVEISAARHRELLEAQASGAAIIGGDKGQPLIDRPRVTLASRRAALVRKVKREAAHRIDRVSPLWRQLNDQRDPSPEATARFATIDAIRAASNAIEAEIAAASAAALDALPIAANTLWPAE